MGSATNIKTKERWKDIKEQERWKQSEQGKTYRQKKDKDGSNNEIRDKHKLNRKIRFIICVKRDKHNVKNERYVKTDKLWEKSKRYVNKDKHKYERKKKKESCKLCEQTQA